MTTITSCPPNHTAYPSQLVADNAVELHRLAFRYCEAFHAWPCGDHWHVGHPNHEAGDACKTHPTHRAIGRRIERANKDRTLAMNFCLPLWLADQFDQEAIDYAAGRIPWTSRERQALGIDDTDDWIHATDVILRNIAADQENE